MFGMVDHQYFHLVKYSGVLVAIWFPCKWVNACDLCLLKIYISKTVGIVSMSTGCQEHRLESNEELGNTSISRNFK